MEAIEEILLRALAAAYKKSSNHPDDVITLSRFLGSRSDKSVISEVVKTVPVDLTPEQVFQIIQATQDADYFHDAYLREKEVLDTWIDGWQKMRDVIQIPDDRSKDQRRREATPHFYGRKPKRDMVKIIKEYDYITIDTTKRPALSHADALEALKDRHGWPSTDAVRKALKRAGCILRTTR